MNYQATMQAKRTLANELRSRSYIHDLMDKEFAAQFFGLPIKTFYHAPLDDRGDHETGDEIALELAP
jgi:hypothetical protein